MCAIFHYTARESPTETQCGRAATKSKTFDAEEKRKQRIETKIKTFNAEEPEKKKPRNGERRIKNSQEEQGRFENFRGTSVYSFPLR